jgi:FtsH-binding integral membrane protein
MYVYDEQSNRLSFSAFALWGNLFMSILFAVAMGYVGVMYTATLSPFITLLWIVEFAMLLAVAFLRKRKSMSYGMAYAFTGISGLVVGAGIGANPVYMRVVGTSAVEALGLFAVLSLVAIVSGEAFMGLGKALFAMLIALVIVDLISIFAFKTAADQLVLSSVSGILFCGFILYDVQRAFRKQHVESIPMLVVNIYLDLLNLFLSILNINAFFSRK